MSETGGPPDPGKSGFVSFFTSLPGIITAVAGLISALAAVGILQSDSPNPPPTTEAIVSPSRPSPDPATTPPPTEPPQPAEPVSFTLLVGIRPTLGQLSESMEFILDGKTEATWTSNQANPSQTISLETSRAGQHRYRLRGEYSYLDPNGAIRQSPVTGSGTVTIAEGTRLGILYLGGTAFRVEPLP
jgi:hypothetical protein